MSKKKKKPEPSPKEPREMTSEEALENLFHPEIVKKVREHVRESDEPFTEDH